MSWFCIAINEELVCKMADAMVDAYCAGSHHSRYFPGMRDAAREAAVSAVISDQDEYKAVTQVVREHDRYDIPMRLTVWRRGRAE